MIFGLFGPGGFGREVMGFAGKQIPHTDENDKNNTKVFIQTSPELESVNGYPILSEDRFFNSTDKLRYFNIAVGDSKQREAIAHQLLSKGAFPLSLFSNDAIQYDENVIDEGAIICANSMITSNAKIGKFFHANIYSYVAHDCVVGDWVTFAPFYKPLNLN